MKNLTALLERHTRSARLLGLAGLYALSFVLWLFPWTENFVLASFLCFAALWWRFGRSREPLGQLWLQLLFLDLVLDAFGHAFELTVFSVGVSIRYVLFTLTITGFLISEFREYTQLKKTWYDDWRDALAHLPGYWPLAWLLLLVWGVGSALSFGRQTSLILADASAWMFLFVVFPLLRYYSNATSRKNLLKLLYDAVLVLSGFTIAQFYFFAHAQGFEIDPVVFRWVRDTRLAEVTILSSGAVRVFIQSQLFLIIAWLNFALNARSKRVAESIFEGTLITAALILSLSRSFALAIVASLTLYWITKRITDRASIMRSVFSFLGRSIPPLLFALIVIGTIFIIPFPSRTSSEGLYESFHDRFLDVSQDKAIGSRWALLPELRRGITEHPWRGWGFGKTITYKSSDPRILEVDPTGTYSPYRFEWGYLDFWLKWGIIGLVLFLLSLAALGWQLFRLRQHPYGTLAFVSLLVLSITHFFTPYFNHPLGLGYLFICQLLAWEAMNDSIDKPTRV